MITDRRVLLEFAPDLARVLREFLATPHAEQAGANLNDVVRVTYVLPQAEEFSECWPILRKYFDDVRPATMMISAGLADPRMKIEIEVTACRRSSGQPRTRKATK